MGEGPVRYRKQSVVQGVRRMVPAAMVGLVAFSGALVVIGSASYTAAVPHLVEVAKNAPVGTVSHAAYEALNNSTAELGAVMSGAAPVPVADAEALREQFGADLVPNALDAPAGEGRPDGPLALQGGLAGLGGLLAGPPAPAPDPKPEGHVEEPVKGDREPSGQQVEEIDGKPIGGAQEPGGQKPDGQDIPSGPGDSVDGVGGSIGGSAPDRPSDRPSGKPSETPSAPPADASPAPDQKPEDGSPGLKPPLPDAPPVVDADFERYRAFARERLDAVTAFLPRVEEYTATFVRECRTASPDQHKAYAQQGVDMDVNELTAIMRPVLDGDAPNNEECRRWKRTFGDMHDALSLYLQCYYNAWGEARTDWTEKDIRRVMDSAQYHRDYFNSLYQGIGL